MQKTLRKSKSILSTILLSIFVFVASVAAVGCGGYDNGTSSFNGNGSDQNPNDNGNDNGNGDY